MSKENPVFFISYAPADTDHYKFFNQLFRKQMPLNWSQWIDEDIVLNENWFNQINKALIHCDFGLLLLSSNFVTSPFVTSPFVILDNINEIFKKTVSVLLKPFNKNKYSFFNSITIFTFNDIYDRNNKKAFSEMIKYSNHNILSLEKEVNMTRLFQDIQNKFIFHDLSCSIQLLDKKSNNQNNTKIYDDIFMSIASPKMVLPNSEFVIYFLAYTKSNKENAIIVVQKEAPQIKFKDDLEFAKWKIGTSVSVKLS